MLQRFDYAKEKAEYAAKAKGMTLTQLARDMADIVRALRMEQRASVIDEFTTRIYHDQLAACRAEMWRRTGL